MRSVVAPLKISVVIVSWNSRDVLPACLRAVQVASDSWAGSVEVILVDNASADGTVESVSVEFPHMRVLQMGENAGFPKACNAGVDASSGDYVLMLNPDVEIAAETFSTCIGRLEQDRGVGLLGVRLVGADGVTQPECARRFPHEWWLLCEALYLHKLAPRTRLFGGLNYGEWDHLSERDVPCIVGAFMLFRGSVLRGLGGLDESVFMYFEDIDVCQRVWDSGSRVLFLPEPAAVHQAGTSRARANARLSASLDTLKGEVVWRFYALHRPRWRARIIAAEIVFYALVRLLVVPVVEMLLHRSPRQAGYAIRVSLALLSWAIRPKRG